MAATPVWITAPFNARSVSLSLSLSHTHTHTRLVSHVLHLLPLRFASSQPNWCCIGKSMMMHQQESDWNWNQPWLSYRHWKCMSVDSWVWILHKSSQLCPEQSTKFEDVVLKVCFFNPHRTNHTVIKYRCPVKKSDETTPAFWVVCGLVSLRERMPNRHHACIRKRLDSKYNDHSDSNSWRNWGNLMWITIQWAQEIFTLVTSEIFVWAPRTKSCGQWLRSASLLGLLTNLSRVY